jgi:hypothetical protein
VFLLDQHVARPSALADLQKQRFAGDCVIRVP